MSKSKISATTANNISPSEALVYLFFHFCRKDGQSVESEIDFISGKFVQLGLKDVVDFRESAREYEERRTHITDDRSYLRELIDAMKPVHTLALYSWCAEIALSDGVFSDTEERLLDELALVLDISANDATVTKRLMIERSIADRNLLF